MFVVLAWLGMAPVRVAAQSGDAGTQSIFTTLGTFYARTTVTFVFVAAVFFCAVVVGRALLAVLLQHRQHVLIVGRRVGSYEGGRREQTDENEPRHS